MKHCFALIALFILTTSTTIQSQGQPKISYQGLLTTAPGGAAVPNGSYDLQFTFYDSVSGCCGSGQVNLFGTPVNHGRFNVILGSSGELSYFNIQQQHYVEIVALNGPAGLSYPLKFSPRSMLSCSPYAFAPWSTTTAGDLYYDGSGNVGVSIYNPVNKFNTGSAEFNGPTGIGTDNPGEPLTVAGSMEIGTSSSDYNHLRIGGGNSSGFLYGKYPELNDGIDLGYNWYMNAAGTDIVPNLGGATSRVWLGYGFMGLEIGGENHSPNAPGIFVAGIGHVGIGTYTPGYLLQVGDGGDGTQARGNAWNTFSDRRFKRDIYQIDDALDKVTRLRGVNFRWRTSGERSTGFIAQEAQEIVPSIVSTDAEGYKSLDYLKMTAVLVQAVKEQQQQIESLIQKIRSLALKKQAESAKPIGSLK